MTYKLLIADDESRDRDALCAALNLHLGEYLTIIEAKTGSQALALFSREQPELAILNVELPEISGLRVAETIRKSGRICVILFTSSQNDFTCAKQAFALRALDYFSKPWDEERLVASVRDAIRYVSHLQSIAATNSPFSSPGAESRPPANSANRLSLVRDEISAYIDAHYTEELSMKNVAQAMSYSESYFCKLFKECFQVNFSTYLNQYRIQKAITMMENPRISVKDISRACGYADSNYFARVFKRVTDQTPSEYRLTMGEKH